MYIVIGIILFALLYCASVGLAYEFGYYEGVRLHKQKRKGKT